MKNTILFKFLLLLTILMGVASCSDDELIAPPEGEGKLPGVPISRVSIVSILDRMVMESEVLDNNEIICHLEMQDNLVEEEAYSVHARFMRIRGKTELRLDEPLHIGTQVLHYISYRGATDPKNAPLRTLGMGQTLIVTEDNVTVEGRRNEETRLMGEGTKEKPFKISCENDLLILQGLVNKDETGVLFKESYFEQVCDIDMTFSCDYMNVEYGWLPIGYNNTRPFRGFYNGKGHTIKNLRIQREEGAVGGLFGCLYGAKIDSLVMDCAYVEVPVAAGVVAGAAIAAGSDNQPGGVMVNNQLSHCKVTNSKVKTGTYGGMLIGMADAYSRLYVDSCMVTKDNELTVDLYGGGVVGSGAFQSLVTLMDVSNATDVTTSMGCAGGLIGTSDTLLVINGYNTGNIKVEKMSADNDERFAAGGIAGGTADGQFINCINQGNVSGDRGVGGILGSALLSKGDGTEENPGLYYNAFFMASVNTGTIQANRYAGGICGEAQTSAVSCANSGMVTSKNEFAGGIVSNAPGLALLDCSNMGAIKAHSRAGGLAGLSLFSSIGFCANHGAVEATNKYSGGILALGGGGVIINYCGNYGHIKGGTAGSCGGIVGELGKVREWAAVDIASVVMGAIGIVASTVSVINTVGFQVDKGRGLVGRMDDCLPSTAEAEYHIVDLALHAVNIWSSIPNIVLAGLDIDYRLEGHTPWTEEQALAMRKNMTERTLFICDSVATVRKGLTKTAILCESINKEETLLRQDTCFEAERLRVNGDADKLQNYSDQLNVRRYNLQSSVTEDKALRNMKFDITNGVLAAASLALFVLSVIPVTSVFAVSLAAGIVGVAFGATTIAKSAMNFQENASEISQCYNFGVVEGGDNTGGIVGTMNDYGHLYDSYNGGTVKGNGSDRGLLVGQTEDMMVIVNNFDISAQSNTDSEWGDTFAGNTKWRVENNYTITKGNISEMQHSSAYKGYDFAHNWQKPLIFDGPSYCLPIINKSEYARPQ